MATSKSEKIFHAGFHEIADAVDALPWDDWTFYEGWLIQSYFISKQASRLLAHSAGLTKPEDDGLHQLLLDRANRQALLGKLALRDLGDLQSGPAPALEISGTEIFYKSQRDLLNDEGMSPVLGWLLFLEGFSEYCGLEIFSRVSEHGQKRLRYATMNSVVEDKQFQHTLQACLDLDPSALGAVANNFKFSKDCYLSVLGSLEYSRNLFAA